MSIGELAQEAKSTREGIHMRISGTSKIGAVSRVGMVIANGVQVSDLGYLYIGTFETKIQLIAPTFAQSNILPHQNLPVFAEFLEPDYQKFKDMQQQWPESYMPFLELVEDVRSEYLESLA